MSYVAQSHVSVGQLATATEHNQTIDNIALLKTSIADDGTIVGTTGVLTTYLITPHIQGNNNLLIDTPSNAYAVVFGGYVQVQNNLELSTPGTYVSTPRVYSPVNLTVDTAGAMTFGATQYQFFGPVTAFQGYDTYLSRPILSAYKEQYAVPSIVSGVLTIDLSLANHFVVNLNANITTLTITNSATPSGTNVAAFSLRLQGDGTQRTVAWPAVTRWAYGSAPTPTATNGLNDIYDFQTENAGSFWWATVRGQRF